MVRGTGRFAGETLAGGCATAAAALGALSQLRELVFAGRWSEAQSLAGRAIVSPSAHGMPFQTCGEALLSFPGHERHESFRRELDLETAVVTTSYVAGGVGYQREIFASLDANAIVVRLTADAGI